MPAFSYRGLPHFVQWAGQKPRFCDVDPITHCLDPECVEHVINDQTTSILHVCNFNSPGEISKLSKLAGMYDIPIFLDSVYGMGCSYDGIRLGGFGQAEVYSLHATKLINGFEGGYITTNDDGLADILRWQRNFALPGLQPGKIDDKQYILGTNAKLNELHAAMALLSLKRIDEIIHHNKSRYMAYREIFKQIPGIRILPCDDNTGDKRNYQMVVIEVDSAWPLSRDQMLMLLKAEGCAINAYYSPPLHQSKYITSGFIDKLPVSEELSRRFLQLPVGQHVSINDVKAIGNLMEFVYENGRDISRKMKNFEY